MVVKQGYQKQLFFCTNQRDNGRKCCNDAGASAMRAYAKERVEALGLSGEHGVRVNIAGCMGRCQLGPSLVIYPEGVWYTYHTQADIDEIINEHVTHNRIVKRLLMSDQK
ncbi:MAG: 2Fe-2S ferredoxin [Gammaproteobacteria bacterium RIFCSPHIGHO2_12_FULL_35_23]|nr:MAG: 2Fe-2S ferredoxin [Gammaproteobacteria bacterium RIFCSPHIGHO2_12_FULL_35_23]